jgi:phage tail sheath gpL-like
VAYRGTFSGLTTFGVTLNDPHMSLLGFNDTPTPMWKVAAALAAQAAISVRADQAQPIRERRAAGRAGAAGGLALQPQPAQHPAVRRRLDLQRRPVGRNVILEKLITTYQKNAFNAADNSLPGRRDPVQPGRHPARLKGVVTSKYGRVKLAADGTFLQPGSAW